MAAATNVRVWAESGAMALTGRAGGPPSPVPADTAGAMAAAAADLAAMTRRWGESVVIDGPGLLGERAAIAGLGRAGDVSAGGGSRFLAAADGPLVLSLPRPEDVAALPALVGEEVEPGDWSTIASLIATRPRADLRSLAIDLGLAVAIPGERPRMVAPARELARGGPRDRTPRPLVIDLTSLWAGPLLTSLLGAAGARVVKVEGADRIDGARRGPADFYNLLNHEKECISLDLADRTDVSLLRRLIAAADLVVEGSRPRVMDQLAIAPEAVAAGGTSWLSITGHGRTGPDALRVGFGDDTAAAGGLIDHDGAGPLFVGDAIADPLAGVAGAAIGAELLASDQASVVEVPLARVAAWAAGIPRPHPVRTAGEDRWEVQLGTDWIPVAPPRARPRRPGAAPPGAHSDHLRQEFAAD